MRYNTPIYFQTVKAGEYDEKSGNYTEDTVTEVKKYASVTATVINTLNIVYGSIKQGSLTIRIQPPFAEPFDFIRVGDKRYRVDLQRNLYSKQTFIVSEVQ